MFENMLYGPLGDAVADALPHTEADPVGVLAASLSLWSAAINGRILQPSGRPTVFWSALVGRSKFGRKGFALATAQAVMDPSIGSFLKTRSRKGITSGPSLVTVLFEAEQMSKESESGMDGRVLITEGEWASVLKRANRDDTYHDQLINAWDGMTMSNTTKGKDGKRDEQRVEHPLLGYHVHIQPGRWAKLARPDVALGGAFNRIPHFVVSMSKNLPSTVGRPLDAIKENKDLTDAYNWAQQGVRVLKLSRQAARMHDEYRMEFDQRCASLPEDVSCFVERADENILRVACLLAAAERKATVSPGAWEAARTVMEYSMESTLLLINETKNGKLNQNRPQTVEEIIRDTLHRYGGEATRGMVLRRMGTRGNADSLTLAVKNMPDVVEEKIRSAAKGGAPSHMLRLVSDYALNRQKPQQTELQKKLAAAL